LKTNAADRPSVGGGDLSRNAHSNHPTVSTVMGHVQFRFTSSSIPYNGSQAIGRDSGHTQVPALWR